MRVPISIDALRLATLVVAGVASGYLWRAAFEPTGGRPAALAPSVVGEALAPEPPVRITVTTALPRAARKTRSRSTRNRRGVFTSGRARVPSSARGTGSVRPVQPPRQPSPNPTPPSAPPPPSGPGSGTGPGSTSPPAAPAPVQPAPPNGAGPTQTPPAPVTHTAAPPAAPPAPDAEDKHQPGWGHGDKNHEHSGPPGDDDSGSGGRKRDG
jgi:hypothetical protein